MAILFLVIFLMTIFAYISEPNIKRNKTDVFYVAVIVVSSLFIGLRSGYNDTAAYIRSFVNAEPLSLFLVDAERMHIFHNPLFYGTVALIKEYTNNYHIFFMLVAIFDSILLIRFIRDYCSGYFAYSIFLYWGYNLGVFGLAAMKQITAMAILTWAVSALLDKKYIRFVLIVIIAGLVHTYAFLFLALPLLTSKPWEGKTFAIVLSTGVIMLNFNSTISAFLEYADAAGKSVASFEVFDGIQMNIFRIIIFAIVPVLILVFKNRLVPLMSKKQYLLSNMSIVSLMFMMLARVNGANMFGRLATYFVFGNICLLGWVIGELFNERSRKVLYIVSIILFLGFIAYDNMDFATTGGYSSIGIVEFVQSLF